MIRIKAAILVLDHFKVAVSKDKPVVIGAPLRGGSWRCSNGPAYNSVHQYLTIREGKVRIAQRFAFDFNKVDAEGNILPSPFPDEITNNMLYGCGAKVLAVADGVVAYVKDGIPENVPQASGEIIPAVPITRETVAGNWISINLGMNRYAFYAHLQPGSCGPFSLKNSLPELIDLRSWQEFASLEAWIREELTAPSRRGTYCLPRRGRQRLCLNRTEPSRSAANHQSQSHLERSC